MDLGEGCAWIPPRVPPMGPHGTPVYGPAQPSRAPAPAQLWDGSWGKTSRDEPGSLCLGAGSRGGCCSPPHSTLPGHNPGVSAGSDTAGSCSFLGVRPCCFSKTGIVLLGRVQTCLAPRAAEDPVQFTFSKGQILPLLRTANLSDLLQFGEKIGYRKRHQHLLCGMEHRVSGFKTCPRERHSQTQGARSSVTLLQEINVI